MASKLSIINHMLSVLGADGTTDENSLHPSVQHAIRVLETANETFQARGWWFNTERNLPLAPDNLGRIIVPSETIQVQPTQRTLQYQSHDEKLRYTVRKGMIYDTIKHTFEIGTPVNVDIVLRLDIEDMPGVAANYLMHSAAEDIFVDDDGDETKANRLSKKTAFAWQQLYGAQLKAQATSALDAPVAQALRYRSSQYGLSTNPRFPGGRGW